MTEEVNVGEVEQTEFSYAQAVDAANIAPNQKIKFFSAENDHWADADVGVVIMKDGTTRVLSFGSSILNLDTETMEADEVGAAMVAFASRGTIVTAVTALINANFEITPQEAFDVANEQIAEQVGDIRAEYERTLN